MFYKALGFLLICTISFSAIAEHALYIFVSFSMPAQSLKLWAEQANHAGGQLLLRGFVENDLQKTTAKTIAVFGEEPDIDLSIDPEIFQTFNIQAVPAVVIATSQPIDGPDNVIPDFDVVYGDTSLEEALLRITKRGSAESRKAALRFLEQIRNGEHHE